MSYTRRSLFTPQTASAARVWVPMTRLTAYSVGEAPAPLEAPACNGAGDGRAGVGTNSSCASSRRRQEEEGGTRSPGAAGDGPLRAHRYRVLLCDDDVDLTKLPLPKGARGPVRIDAEVAPRVLFSFFSPADAELLARIYELWVTSSPQAAIAFLEAEQVARVRDDLAEAPPSPRPFDLVVVDMVFEGAQAEEPADDPVALVEWLGTYAPETAVLAWTGKLEAPGRNVRGQLIEVGKWMVPYVDKHEMGPDVSAFVHTIHRVVERQRQGLPEHAARVAELLIESVVPWRMSRGEMVGTFRALLDVSASGASGGGRGTPASHRTGDGARAQKGGSGSVRAQGSGRAPQVTGAEIERAVALLDAALGEPAIAQRITCFDLPSARAVFDAAYLLAVTSELAAAGGKAWKGALARRLTGLDDAKAALDRYRGVVRNIVRALERVAASRPTRRQQ